MKETSSRKRIYRDELNFAEFPIASLSKRLPPNLKTLQFTDTIFDRGLNKEITRTLTVSASDKYGLPTATDDEIVLGLIQLTKESAFNKSNQDDDRSSRKVYFTRYELIEELGWKHTTKVYRRI